MDQNVVTTLNPVTNEPGDPIEKAVQLIMGELNNISRTARRSVAKRLLYAVAADHRTQQQAFWSAILLAQIDYANESYDARNEQSIKFAKEVAALARAKNFDLGGFLYL